MIDLYHQTNTPIGFWSKWELNLISLIQLSKTLPVELIGTYQETGPKNLVSSSWHISTPNKKTLAPKVENLPRLTFDGKSYMQNSNG